MNRPPVIVTTIVNRVVSAVLRSRFHGLLDRRVLLLSFSGRTSGRWFTVPVGYSRRGNTIMVSTRSAWSQNLRGGAWVILVLRGQEFSGWATLVPRPADGRWRDGELIAIEDPQRRLPSVEAKP